MTNEQFSILNNIKQGSPLITGKLVDGEPRTLLFGYRPDMGASWFSDPRTVHIYLYTDNKIYIHRYSGLAVDGDISANRAMQFTKSEDELNENADYTLGLKRLYPEACDYKFCWLLKKAGVYLPFTTFDENRKPALWHGMVHDSLQLH